MGWIVAFELLLNGSAMAPPFERNEHPSILFAAQHSDLEPARWATRRCNDYQSMGL
jgi:hypothetical protein